MNNEQIQFLIDNLQEGLAVEVKNWLNGLNSNDDKAKLAKELIALANNGGGHFFVGFDDEHNLAEIEPLAGQLESFTQDSISSIVQRYAEPSFQCEVGYFQKTGSHISHPVIQVPGKHRTPVYAKAGSPDGQTLRTGSVYVRRPGGYSEPARTQDDWEKLLDRLVKSRQSEQLEAIRQIMEPGVAQPQPEELLLQWQNESMAAWRQLVEALPPNSPHRLLSGHWSLTFSISEFTTPTLAELNTALDREMPKYTGWPPFTYLHHQPKRPNAQGRVIQAWLVDQAEKDASHSDFWRVSSHGFGFLLRPMQEDRVGYAGNRAPMPVGPFFDWVLPIWRMAEILKFIEALALRFSNQNSQYSIILNYQGMRGRSLFNRDWKYNLDEDATCNSPAIEARQTAQIHQIRTNIEELVFELLTPIFEQFEFQELPKLLVTNVLAEVFRSRR